MKLFLSYRRADSQYVSDRLYEALTKELGPGSVFKDIDSVPLGADFRSVVAGSIAKCDALLIVIGARWLDSTDADGHRRLDNSDDYVRSEIEAALELGLTIIPLLAENVSMPKASDLPQSISQITYRNAAAIRPDPEFSHDVARLIRSLEKIAMLRSGASEADAKQRPGAPPRLRYFCYVSRAKVSQLISQLKFCDNVPTHDEVTAEKSLEYLSYLQGLAYGSGRGWSDLDMTDTIQQLRHVLWHIVNYEPVGDLNTVLRERAHVPLDAFCYTYSGQFRIAKKNRNDDQFGDARQQHQIVDRSSLGAVVTSPMAQLSSTCSKHTLHLACSTKYFSDMGGQELSSGDWAIKPHSGNAHFFAGNVAVWFDAVVFINGMSGKQLYGTPLFLVTGVDPNLRI